MPFLSTVADFITIRYKDKYGNYHETYDKTGENDYGPDPKGKQADIPLENNPILAAISRAEESKFLPLIIGVMFMIIPMIGMTAKVINEHSNEIAVNIERPNINPTAISTTSNDIQIEILYELRRLDSGFRYYN